MKQQGWKEMVFFNSVSKISINSKKICKNILVNRRKLLFSETGEVLYWVVVVNANYTSGIFQE